ncbi:phage tail protein [Methylobacter sp.]
MDTFTGFITAFPWNWAPRDWSTCQGQVLQIQQNAALYALLGVAFGGNGSSTFALPELRGKQIIGYGVSPTTQTNFPFASHSGAEKVTLTTAQTGLATHTHTAAFTPGGGSSSVNIAIPAVSGADATANSPGTGVNLGVGIADLSGAGLDNGPANIYSASATNTTLKPFSVSVPAGSGTVAVSPAGTPVTAAVPLMNPYLALNFCIAINGFFPSRN